jgi:hypothetical protein
MPSPLAPRTVKITTVSGGFGYYPFGMMQEGRQFIGGMGYRWGFGSQEADNEVSGRGNSYTAEFWQYDSRLGRRWNLDPNGNVSLSEYATFSNSPLMYGDPLGDTMRISSDCSPKMVRKIERAIGLISQTPEGKRILDEIQKSTKTFTIETGKPEYFRFDNGRGGIVKYNGLRDKHSIALFVHELGHAEDDHNGRIMKLRENEWITPDLLYTNGEVHFHWSRPKGSDKLIPGPTNESEASAMDKENKFRKEFGANLREFYGHQEVINTVTNIHTGTVVVMERKVINYYQVHIKGIGTHPNYSTNYNSISKVKIKHNLKYNEEIGRSYVEK